MDIFEKKYKVKEDAKTRAFHLSRRMFYIYQNKLFVAESDLPYSHAVWFEKKGLISRKKDKLIDEIIRGIIDGDGNIYFYVGYDFEINKEIESLFFSHLKELTEKLKLKFNAKIFGGLIKQKVGKWPPRRAYGKIKDNL